MQFGQETINHYNSQIDNLTAQIEALQQQLEKLRETKKALEVEAQAKLTLIGAGTSALEQCENFIKLALTGENDDLIADFWEKMESLKSCSTAIAYIPATTDVEETTATTEEEETEPEKLENEATIEVTPEETEIIEDMPDKKELLESQFSVLKVSELRKYCRELNLSDKGVKKDLIERLVDYHMEN